MKFKEWKTKVSDWLAKRNEKTQVKTVTKIAEMTFGWQLRKIETELKKTKSQQKAIEEKKKIWDEAQGTAGEKFNEDKISTLRSEIKKNQITIARLNETLRLQTKVGERTEVENRIDYLNGLNNNNENQLKAQNEKFKKYLEISGMKFAEFEAKKEELEMQLSGASLIYAFWIWLVFLVVLFSLVVGIAPVIVFTLFQLVTLSVSIGIGITTFFFFFLFVMGGIIAAGYNPVPEKEEWVMELFGKFVIIWRHGPHIKFPIFMNVRGKVYRGNITLPLHFNNKKEGEEKPNSMVDFLNASAGVAVDVFYKIFSTYRAIYNIDDLPNAISEKMEAGIRAYYGNQPIDEAIAGRAEVDLRKIITQNATEAEVFKSWGASIISLAVTNFDLPKAVEDSRMTKLTAEKAKEVAEIQQQQALIEATTATIKGEQEGNRLKQLATTISQSIDKVIEYDLMVKRLAAYEKSGLLIVGDQGDAKLSGAIAGAAAQIGAKAATK
ncbi:MAG: SPFH domain-containing protein [bacterium]|nr:SPFH domain-containing protein [bacterium]